MPFVCFSQEYIKTIGPQKAYDASHDYFINIIELALAKANSPSKITLVPYQGQARTLRLLSSTDIFDIVWTADSQKRDEDLLKIAIPLFKGGLGWRGSIIRKDFKPIFDNIKDLSGLANYVACQGLHWPDADILIHAGLTVQKVTHFNAMLEMLELKRCDYLPLSIFEGHGELALAHNNFPNLIFDQKLVIVYAATMNFYVKTANTLLAATIEQGLHELMISGEFEKFMKNHPLTRAAFPLSQFESSTFIQIGIRENSPYMFKWPG